MDKTGATMPFIAQKKHGAFFGGRVFLVNGEGLQAEAAIDKVLGLVQRVDITFSLGEYSVANVFKGGISLVSQASVTGSVENVFDGKNDFAFHFNR